MAPMYRCLLTPMLLATCILHAAVVAGKGLPKWTGLADSAARGTSARPAAHVAGVRRRLLQARSQPGLAVQVYNPYGSPYALPIPGSARPTALATAPNVSYPDVSSGGVFALANATANFALRLTGSINLPGNKTQNYTFSMDSDDDSLLYMDGKQVVSDTGSHGFNGGKSATLSLAPGQHAIEIDYIQRTGLAGIVLKAAAAEGTAAAVPSSWFSHVPLTAPPPPAHTSPTPANKPPPPGARKPPPPPAPRKQPPPPTHRPPPPKKQPPPPPRPNLPPPPPCTGEGGRSADYNQCADYSGNPTAHVCCPGYECKFVVTEGPDYGAHFCTAVQCPGGNLYDYAEEGIKCCPSDRELCITGYPEVCCNGYGYPCDGVHSNPGGIGLGDCPPPIYD